MRKLFYTLIAAVAVSAGMMSAAQARVFVSIGIPAPVVYAAPAYYPPPVYYPAPRVAYAPYYAPAPVYYAPRPYYAPRYYGHYHGGRHWR